MWGLFATYGWPVDIVGACPPDRRRRIERLLRAARHRKLGLVLGLGTYSRGYDQIIAADPEFMIACGGRFLRDPNRAVPDVVMEVLKALYRPRNDHTVKTLMSVFQMAEDSYFNQWSDDRFRKLWGVPLPGECKLDQRLFGTSPGPATYLKEPCLDAAGRKEYRKGLRAILSLLPQLEGSCQDGGRLRKVHRSVITTLNLLNTVSYCLGEPID